MPHCSKPPDTRSAENRIRQRRRRAAAALAAAHVAGEQVSAEECALAATKAPACGDRCATADGRRPDDLRLPKRLLSSIEAFASTLLPRAAVRHRSGQSDVWSGATVFSRFRQEAAASLRRYVTGAAIGHSSAWLRIGKHWAKFSRVIRSGSAVGEEQMNSSPGHQLQRVDSTRPESRSQIVNRTATRERCRVCKAGQKCYTNPSCCRVYRNTP